MVIFPRLSVTKIRQTSYGSPDKPQQRSMEADSPHRTTCAQVITSDFFNSLFQARGIDALPGAVGRLAFFGLVVFRDQDAHADAQPDHGGINKDDNDERYYRVHIRT